MKQLWRRFTEKKKLDKKKEELVAFKLFQSYDKLKIVNFGFLNSISEKELVHFAKYMKYATMLRKLVLKTNHDGWTNKFS